MNKHFNPHFNRNVVTIYPGEFWSSCGSEMISTILGSCVSIALFDPIARVGGMNHFLLAKQSKQKSDTSQSQMQPGHFGEYAVDLLISDMEQKGAVLKRCSAKIFGGANIFNAEKTLKGEMVGASNVKFAFDYLLLQIKRQILQNLQIKMKILRIWQE